MSVFLPLHMTLVALVSLLMAHEANPMPLPGGEQERKSPKRRIAQYNPGKARICRVTSQGVAGIRYYLRSNNKRRSWEM